MLSISAFTLATNASNSALHHPRQHQPHRLREPTIRTTHHVWSVKGSVPPRGLRCTLHFRASSPFRLRVCARERLILLPSSLFACELPSRTLLAQMLQVCDPDSLSAPHTRLVSTADISHRTKMTRHQRCFQSLYLSRPVSSSQSTSTPSTGSLPGKLPPSLPMPSACSPRQSLHTMCQCQTSATTVQTAKTTSQRQTSATTAETSKTKQRNSARAGIGWQARNRPPQVLLRPLDLGALCFARLRRATASESGCARQFLDVEMSTP